MRKTCLDCVRKHIGQAIVLLDETHLGYPHHRWIAIGHLAEAESESLDEYPEVAKCIREQRLLIMKSFEDSKKHSLEDILRCVCVAAGEDDIAKHENSQNSKIFDAPTMLNLQ